MEKGVWCTYGDGVYDVTDFVANHPGGGDKIMLAAGKSLDPFWRVYQQHFRTTLAMDILEQHKIGELPTLVVDCGKGCVVFPRTLVRNGGGGKGTSRKGT